MSLVANFLMIVVYLAAGYAAALWLPERMSGVLPSAGPVSLVHAALALAALALLHATFAGFRWRARARRELAELRQANADVRRELGTARTEVQQIFEAIQSNRSMVRDEAYQNVIKEVKVLQELIGRLQASRAPVYEPAGAPPADDALDDDAVLDIVREALQANRADLFLQPIVELPQRRTAFYDCLSRIRDGDGQAVMPERYVPVAERYGLMGAIDNLLLFRCVQLVRKARQKRDGVAFFAHISGHSLRDARFFRDFISFMADNGELSQNLFFEFSQSDVTDLSPEMTRHLAELSEIGFRFSLDHVTRLDMNFYELSRRGFRYLKVDAGVLIEQLRAMEEEGRAEGFWETLNRAHIDIVPEKVEDETTLVELLDHPIHHAQGYLFGEPRLARE